MMERNNQNWGETGKIWKKLEEPRNTKKNKKGTKQNKKIIKK